MNKPYYIHIGVYLPLTVIYLKTFYNTYGWNGVIKWPNEETRQAMYV